MSDTKKGTDAGKPTKFQLYVIKSDHSVSDIEAELKRVAKNEREVGHAHVLRLDRGKKLVCTDTTFVLLGRSVVAATKSKSFPYEVKSYELNPKRDVLPGGCRSISIRIPNGQDSDWAKKGMQLVMDELVKFNVVNNKAFKIVVPIKQRDTGMHSGKVLIHFDDEVDDEAIVISRVFMHQHFWYFRPTRKVNDRGNHKKQIDIRGFVISAEWDILKERRPRKNKGSNNRDVEQNSTPSSEDTEVKDTEVTDEEVKQPEVTEASAVPDPIAKLLNAQPK